MASSTVDGAINFLLTSLTNISGQYLGKANTYATLPTVDAEGNAVTTGDWAQLAADDVGTGTAAAPEYAAGLYRYDGSDYIFDYAPQTFDALTLAEAILGTGTVPKVLSAEILSQFIDYRNRYFNDPVIGLVSDITTVTGAADGDRYLQTSNPPIIKVRVAGAWTDVDFPDGATVASGEDLYRNSGGIIIRYQPTTRIIQQNSHNLTLPTEGVIPAYRNGGVITPAFVDSDGEQTKSLWIVGIPDANHLEIAENEIILTVTGHSLTDKYYWLGTTPGSLSATITADVEQLLLEVIDNNTLKLLDAQPRRNDLA